MEYEYLKWLIESIDPRHIVGAYYQPVLDELYLTDFRWGEKFPDDENRARDGLALRDLFAEDRGIVVSDIGIDWRGCSCLEMMIAIARRIEYEIIAVPGCENIPKWFWRFTENMGLGVSERRISDIRYVDDMIRNWLDRRYKKDGEGGIFVVKDSYFDMRKMTIWKQMNAVLNEEIDF